MNLKILYITGWCRNGSTIIGNILDEVPGFTHVGELHFLWKNAAGYGVNSRCGCGLDLTACSLWSEVLRQQLRDRDPLDQFAAEVMRRQHAYTRTRHTWRILRRGLRNPEIRAHAELLGQTYHAIAVRTGSSVIVDSSKMAGEAALLPLIAGVTPYYVHLVRDPRAAAFSWRTPKDYVYAMPAGKSTLYWDGFNLAARAVAGRYRDRSLFVRYEDFIAEPAHVMGSLLSFCGFDPGFNPVRGRSVHLTTNHTVTGNPDRFRTGDTVIRNQDDAWIAGLPVGARVAATTWSLPLLHAYGYRARGPAPSKSIDRTIEEGTLGSGA